MEKKDVSSLGPCDALAQNCSCGGNGKGGSGILCKAWWELMTLVFFWPLWWVYHVIRIPAVSALTVGYVGVLAAAFLLWCIVVTLLALAACNWKYVKRQWKDLGVLCFYTVAPIPWMVYELADHCLMGLLPDPMPWLPEPGFSQRYKFRPDSAARCCGNCWMNLLWACDKDCARNITFGDECFCAPDVSSMSDDERRFPPLPIALPIRMDDTCTQYLCEAPPADTSSWEAVSKARFAGSMFGILHFLDIFSRYRKHFALQFFWGPCCPLDGPRCALCTAGVRRSKWHPRYPSSVALQGYAARNPYRGLELTYRDVNRKVKGLQHKPGLNFFLENFSRAKAKPPCACLMPHMNYADVEYRRCAPYNFYQKMEEGARRGMHVGDPDWGEQYDRAVPLDEIFVHDDSGTGTASRRKKKKSKKKQQKKGDIGVEKTKKREPSLPDAPSTHQRPSAPDTFGTDSDVPPPPPSEERPPEYHSDMED